MRLQTQMKKYWMTRLKMRDVAVESDLLYVELNISFGISTTVKLSPNVLHIN